MPAAPLPANESQRLETLGSYAILDTLPEQQFDDLTFLAAQICGTPISLLSLVDRDRQWFKSHHGLDATQTPREMSFCAHAILQNGVMEVPDATLDPRFSDNALVTHDLRLRYYAGAPLLAPDGHHLGTLCVIDQKPHQLSPDQLQALEALARQAVSQMEMWRTVRRLEVADGERSLALQVAQETATRLAESEARFRQFMDNSPVMAFIKDAQGRFVYVNAPMKTTFQVKSDSLLGKNDFDWLPFNIATAVRANDVQVLESRETLQLIEMVPTSDGKDHEWLVFKFPICGASGSCYLGGVALDVTEQRRVERLKSEFISVVSHELRTPLTSIRGALGLLSGGVAGTLPAPALQMITLAQKNSERLVLLINDILDIEKIESGQMRFEAAPVDVVALLQNAVEVNGAYAQAVGVRFELDVAALEAAKEKVEVLGDENRLQQVLSNLLSNAVKFTSAGGRVHLQAQLVPPDAPESVSEADFSAQRVQIVVRDEGPGVPDEFVPRLFEKFAQADASSTRKQGGTGLGLAIARAIVEKHDGFLRYLAPVPPQSGATFAFDLRRHHAPAAENSTENRACDAVSEAVSQTNGTGQPRILICEDDSDVAEQLRAIVMHSGFAVDIASSLAQARQLLARGDYAGLTLDLVLPDGNGLDLLAEVRAGARGHEVPVVVVSAHSGAGGIEGEAFEVLDWLRKPIDAQRLLAALSQFTRAEKPRLLHVEDDADIRQVMAAILGDRVDVVAATSLQQAHALLDESTFDLAILDVGLPDGSGLDLLPLLDAGASPTPVILFCAGEVSREQAQLAATSLVKSRTENHELREVIWRCLSASRN
ncbi:MAG TPA: response regulator [Abditibacterium sp.]